MAPVLDAGAPVLDAGRDNAAYPSSSLDVVDTAPYQAGAKSAS
jgi:hypothetical protein